MSETNIAFKSIDAHTLRTSAPYKLVFDYIRNVVVTNGGTLKKDDMTSGIIEGAWRYGINVFGLRVKLQFRTVTEESEQIELHIKGGFVDAIDTTGAGKRKAQEIIGLISGIAPSPESVMPPRLGDERVRNRGKSRTIAGCQRWFRNLRHGYKVDFG